MSVRLLSRAALVAAVVVLAACGNDDVDTADDTTTTTEDTTTTLEEATTTEDDEADEAACPDAAPIPADATSFTDAPVAYDGNGDGQADTLTVYEHDGDWMLHVEWGAGGTAEAWLDEAGSMGARPLGGHDLSGDGADEAWVAMAGPAAGSIVGIYRTEGCELIPVFDADTGSPFTFTVTATVGTFSGATCDGFGDIDLYFGELAGPDGEEYMVNQSPHTYDDGQLLAEFGDAGSVHLDDLGQYTTLDCGDLAGAL